MNLHLATFRFDVTPPLGHSLCGGWIKPVVGFDDPLEAIGIVILGMESPIVICAVDWTGILNDAFINFRQALADAAHTTADRVCVQCVHQHNAPFVCTETDRLFAGDETLSPTIEPEFFKQCLDRAHGAVGDGIAKARRLTQLAMGKGRVEQVASNRRILGDDGKVALWRGSSCKDENLRAKPEGLIDPWLKTVAFLDGEKKIAALHYYATHPMSYYGDGRVSSDFVGLARKQRQKEEPDCTHIYFTGCAGNIAAGKYNDGTPQARKDLTRRIYEGIVAAEKELRPQSLEKVEFAAESIMLPARRRQSDEEMLAHIRQTSRSKPDRIRPAMELIWQRRSAEGKPPIVISGVRLGEALILHLPSECFLEYQLRAQSRVPESFVAVAAYGDGGPWYIPIEEAFPQGGYEVEMCFCSPRVDDILQSAIEKVTDGLNPS